MTSHSTAVLLVGMAEGQKVLNSREQMSWWVNQPQSPDRYLSVYCLLLPQKTLPQLEHSASLVDTAANLPELSWNSLIPFIPFLLVVLGLKGNKRERVRDRRPVLEF